MYPQELRSLDTDGPSAYWVLRCADEPRQCCCILLLLLRVLNISQYRSGPVADDQSCENAAIDVNVTRS